MLSGHAFFFSTLERAVLSYPILFRRENDGYSDNDSRESIDASSIGLDWLEHIDKMARGRREQWDYIMEMPIIEFFNTLSVYHEIKRRREKRLEQAVKGGFEQYVIACLHELL